MKQYTDKEFELEVQERVNFKLNEIQDAINNEVGRAKNIMGYANNVNAFVRMNEIFKKEKSLPVPYDEMAKQKRNVDKNSAVDAIMNTIEPMLQFTKHSRRIPNIASFIANTIEAVQNKI